MRLAGMLILSKVFLLYSGVGSNPTVIIGAGGARKFAMIRLATCVIAVLAIFTLAACPGADGQYATHDRGANNHP
jgi:hypothetical protein